VRGERLVKALLLAGTLLLTSLTGGGTGHSYTFEWGQKSLIQQNLSLDNLKNNLLQLLSQFGFSEQDNQALNEQINEVFSNIDELNNFHHLKLRRLAQPANEKSRQVTSNIQIAAGDNRVSDSLLNEAEQVIKEVSLPILTKNAGELNSPAHIIFFSGKGTYGRALRKAGIDQSQLKSIVEQTGGITVGSDIWVPLYAIDDESELANILTHELTHVVLNQRGIGDAIPIWVNEGTAWSDGMIAKNQVDPQMAEQETSALNDQLQEAIDNNQLLPLNTSEEDILKAPYNVEWEDHLAVDQLIQNFGQQKYKAFLDNVPKIGVEKSFKQQFGMSISTFEKQFYQGILD
jgi:AraC-like DNA-binding protein